MFEGALGSRHSVPKIEVPYRFNVGDLIEDRYFVRGPIGQGGMGHVLRVQDEITRQVCALKYCAEVRFRRRFAREVRIMESVDSPYVIRILGSNLEYDPPYFVMPLGERSLESDLPSLQGSEDQILDIFGQICLGVKDLHERNIFHRDLKPANVLKLADGLVVVSDLGLARFEDRDTTTLTTVVGRLGTEDYQAPEQMQQGDAGKTDARTDIYQLGKVLYSMLTGCSPRWIETSKLPAGLDHIVQRATDNNPQKRYSTVLDLELAIRRYRDAKNPEKNPRESLESLVKGLETTYPHAVPIAEELGQVMQTLAHGRWLEDNLLISCFHLLPVRWLPIIARDFESELHPILEAYSVSILARVGSYNWDFADRVAERMKEIYDHAPSIATRVLALRNIMVAADRLSRFNAQSVFCNYLQKANAIELALPIAEMIEEYGTPALRNFRGYNIQAYHSSIRDAIQGIGREPRREAETHEQIAAQNPFDLMQVRHEPFVIRTPLPRGD